MMDSEDHSSGGAGNEGYCYNWMEYPKGSRKGIDGDTKRRFNDEQIKSLESMFETQTKLEPKQKLQLARELGLQPRQVSIWFQNKRARWKSKQLEREYNSLRIDYDALLSNFESLKKEKQLLVKEFENLQELVENQIERNKKEPECNNDGGYDSMKQDSDLKPDVFRYDDYKKLNNLSQDKEAEIYIGQPKSSAEQQFCFQSTTWPVDHSTNNTQWWEFWPLNE